MDYKLICGDSLEVLKTGKEKSFRCAICSPPYFRQRRYSAEKQIGLESSVEDYIDSLVAVFREVKRVLTDDGTLWIVIGDSYAGSGGAHKPHHANPGLSKSAERGGVPREAFRESGFIKAKDLHMVPARLALSLQADGWYLRQILIWNKKNGLTESVQDRCTTSHEYILFLAKNKNYYFDFEAIKEESVDPVKTAKRMEKPVFVGKKETETSAGRAIWSPNSPGIKDFDGTRRKRSVWTTATAQFKEAHTATFPEVLIEPMVLAGSQERDFILDPFCGAATSGVVALKNNRRFIGIDISEEYIEISRKRIEKQVYGRS